MQVHFSYQHGSPHQELERIIDMHVRKLEKLLVRFSPDLVHLHGVVEFGTPKSGTGCSLNLWLPTARLHARERGKDVPAALRAAFHHVEDQLKKHKEVLRREGEWKRKRYRGEREEAKAQEGELRVQDRQQVREYLDQVLPQLRIFIQREIRFQELSGTLKPGAVQEEEIVNEVVASALENHKGFSDESAPYHILLKDAIHALNGALPRESPASRAAVSDSAEDAVTAETDPVDACLALLPPKKRQIYVLHALEGFTFDEAAQVLGQLPSEVEEAFREVSREVSTAIQGTRPSGASSQRSA